jgi:hypothetical protein
MVKLQHLQLLDLVLLLLAVAVVVRGTLPLPQETALVVRAVPMVVVHLSVVLVGVLEHQARQVEAVAVAGLRLMVILA